MSTDLVAWDPNSGAALPAHLADAFAEFGSNIQDRQTVPSLSYEGKMWTVIRDGNKQKLQTQNTDGDMVPIPIMRVVILNFNPDRGRAYYPGVYNPAASAAPTCWSADGKAPDTSVKEKQSALCTGCPMSIKGSKVQDGKEMVACGSHRMIALAPAGDLESDPLRLKIAVTSDYDKDVVEHGWLAFRQYVDYLKSRGVGHTALVVTKIKFDPNPAYPKLLFSLDRPLTAEEIGTVKVAMKNPKIDILLAEKWTPAGANGTPTNDADIRPKPEDVAHLAHVGTPDEIWWDGDAWVKPWQTEKAAAPTPPPPAPTPPAPPPPPAAAAPIAAAPKPTDPAHIAHAGTDAEVWWDGTAWVKPWTAAATPAPEPVAPPPPPAPEPEPVHVVAAKPRPSDPAHVAHAGSDAEVWWDGAAWVKPWETGAAAAPPPPVEAPAPAPEPEGKPKPADPGHIAHAGTPNEVWWDGAAWVAPWTAGNAAATPAPTSGAAGSAPTAGTTASPSNADVPADVQGLLDKWTGA